MKTITENPSDNELEPSEVDTFSTSLAPINHPRILSFGLIERLCCVSLLATALTFMRVFLAK
jgi:hypothetical protein